MFMNNINNAINQCFLLFVMIVYVCLYKQTIKKYFNYLFIYYLFISTE